MVCPVLLQFFFLFFFLLPFHSISKRMSSWFSWLFSPPPRPSPPPIVTKWTHTETVNSKQLRIFHLPFSSPSSSSPSSPPPPPSGSPPPPSGSPLSFFCIHGLGGELDQFSEQLEFLAKSVFFILSHPLALCPLLTFSLLLFLFFFLAPPTLCP